MMKINLLWTGGLDSTFRLVELAHQDVEIQPYYIVDTTRRSVPKEKMAMERILSLLRKKKFKKAIIHDIIFIRGTSILPDAEISKARSWFYEYNKLGSQYDLFARFAKQNNITLEVGLEQSIRSKALVVLNEFGSLQIRNYNSSASNSNKDNSHKDNTQAWDSFFSISLEKAHSNAVLLFERLHFPSHLFSIEKIEEAKLLKKWGCNDILNSTWFCHSPIFGYPCGHCNPCKDALNEGMSWRVPRLGRILGSCRNIIMVAPKMINRVRRKIISKN